MNHPQPHAQHASATGRADFVPTLFGEPADPEWSGRTGQPGAGSTDGQRILGSLEAPARRSRPWLVPAALLLGLGLMGGLYAVLQTRPPGLNPQTPAPDARFAAPQAGAAPVAGRGVAASALPALASASVVATASSSAAASASASASASAVWALPPQAGLSVAPSAARIETEQAQRIAAPASSAGLHDATAAQPRSHAQAQEQASGHATVHAAARKLVSSATSTSTATPTAPAVPAPVAAARTTHATVSTADAPSGKAQGAATHGAERGVAARGTERGTAPSPSGGDRDVAVIEAMLGRVGNGKSEAAAPGAGPAAVAHRTGSTGTERAAAKTAHATPSRDAARDIVQRQTPAETTADLVRRCQAVGGLEGLLCRWRICSGRWGSDPACPNSTQQQAQHEP